MKNKKNNFINFIFLIFSVFLEAEQHGNGMEGNTSFIQMYVLPVIY